MHSRVLDRNKILEAFLQDLEWENSVAYVISPLDLIEDSGWQLTNGPSDDSTSDLT